MANDDSLEEIGWAVSSASASTIEGVAAELTALASTLGEIAPGRGGRLFEPILPRVAETARARSLSSKFGLNPLPLHIDTAHWSVPCRYLILACLNTGPVPTPTFLLDSRTVQLSERERLACHSAVFAVRNGRHSFYGSIMDKDRDFIRLDPGCMTALSSEGTSVLDVFSKERQADRLIRHDWEKGNIVILDNWRTLHARGYDTPTALGRVLVRVMVR